jgi:hypothetical protein
MKKLFPLLTLILLLLGTSCTSNDDDKNEVSTTVSLFNHVVNTSTSAVSTVNLQNYALHLDLQNGTGNLSGTVQLTDKGTAETFKTQDFNLTYDSNNAYYKFSASSLTVSGASFATITDVYGIIDYNQGIFKIGYTVNGIYKVTATMNEIYYQNSTTIATANDSSFTHSNAIYDFTIKSTDLSATLNIYSIQFSAKGTTYNSVAITGLKATPTTAGYNITGSNLKTTVTNSSGVSSVGDSIPTLNATLLFLGNKFTADYTIGKYKVAASGTMYNN